MGWDGSIRHGVGVRCLLEINDIFYATCLFGKKYREMKNHWEEMTRKKEGNRPRRKRMGITTTMRSITATTKTMRKATPPPSPLYHRLRDPRPATAKLLGSVKLRSKLVQIIDGQNAVTILPLPSFASLHQHLRLRFANPDPYLKVNLLGVSF